PWGVCEEMAILHGGFLLAAKLLEPRPLRELRKADWPLVGPPIADALREIGARRPAPPRPGRWKQQAVAVVWAKVLLPGPPPASLERGWREDAFFSAGRMIPDVNHAVLFELAKALEAPRPLVRLLLALPRELRRAELQHLVEHVASETSPADVAFFLDVWWEVMKHRQGPEDATASAFGALVRQHGAQPGTPEGLRPPKRFKSDGAGGPGAPSLPMVLVEGLERTQRSIVLPRARCYALANLAELLLAFAGLGAGGSGALPVAEYLDKVCSVVSLWNSDAGSRFHQRGLHEKVREAERSVSLSSVAGLSDEELFAGLRLLRALLHAWGEELQGALRGSEELGYQSYRLLDALDALRRSLLGLADARELSEDERLVVLELTQGMERFLEQSSGSRRSRESDASLASSVAMAIIEGKLDRHLEMCSVFASEHTWASSKDWLECLVRNKALFQSPELVLKLLETVVNFSASSQDGEDHELQKQVTKAILECYTELSLPDKNKVLSGVLDSWGGPGLSLSLQVVMEGFQEELNVTFNQITQSVSDQGLSKAVAAVARLTLLHPEATVKKVCNLAVANVGTHQFLAQILCSFPALSFQEARADAGRPRSLVLRCLHEAVWGKLSTAREEEQFLEFLDFLMQPSSAAPLVSPAEVTRAFVLPCLRSDCAQIELSLRILSKVLGMPSSPEEHWIKSCHPFPLLLSLCKLLDGYTRYWHLPGEQSFPSLETKDLVANTLAQLCDVLRPEAAPSPDVWAQSLAWLHRKVASLDWTVGLRLKKLFGEHFKNEVPETLFEICRLPEDAWTRRPSPAYGPGSGLLAWLECCCLGPELRDTMLALLAVDVDNPEEVNLFSKGFLVALVQVLPWCSRSEWRGLVRVAQSLLQRQVLHVPYTLEYVQYLPLLDLRPFAHCLQLSMLLLRAFQLLCSSSCSAWLPARAWLHVARLYCGSLSELLASLRGAAQELAFVCVQLFCHVLHVAALLPGACAEPLAVVALEALSQYEASSGADDAPSHALRRANERHFLECVADNVADKELRGTLLHKLGKLGA
ncbi:GEMI4 protein, partial [Eudromia elegans]|nr:GEMI4 protein [Eudromia elegans]